jgi:3-oxoacyl-[acyl-carrier protein] reductase
LFGSAGQPNYAAAKAGITAMTMGAAQLMIKYGITCNVIMPRARTAMTDQGATAAMFAKPEDGFDAFDPANVAPLVSYLASPNAGHISGEVFIVWGPRVTIVQRPTIDKHYDNPQGGKWTQEGLQSSLSTYFDANHMPVWGGFSVPPQ